MIRTIIWSSPIDLNCGCPPYKVMLCLKDGLTSESVAPPGFIDGGVLDQKEVKAGTCSSYYQYTIQYNDINLASYDETLQAATTPLSASDIRGAFCKDCLYRWVEAKFPPIICPECPECPECVSYGEANLLPKGLLFAGGRTFQAANNNFYAVARQTSTNHLNGVYKFNFGTSVSSIQLTTEFVNEGSGVFKETILASNGFIYGFSDTANRVCKFDPATETVTFFSGPAQGGGAASERVSEVVEVGGFIYVIPGRNRYIWKLDISTDTGTVIHDYGFNTSVRRFSSAAVASNGKIYCMSGSGSTASQRYFTKIVTPADTVTALHTSNSQIFQQNTCFYAAGYIFGMNPFASGTGVKAAVRVDPNDDSYVTFGSFGYSGTSLGSIFNSRHPARGANGLWYFAPLNYSPVYSTPGQVLIFNPNELTHEFDTYGDIFVSAPDDRWFSFALAANDKLYALPSPNTISSGNESVLILG